MSAEINEYGKPFGEKAVRDVERWRKRVRLAERTRHIRGGGSNPNEFLDQLSAVYRAEAQANPDESRRAAAAREVESVIECSKKRPPKIIFQ